MNNIIAIVFALPIVQIVNLIEYARAKDTKAARVGTFVVFVPIMAITTAVWGAIWLFVIHFAFRIW